MENPKFKFFKVLHLKISGEIRHSCGQTRGHNPAKMPHTERNTEQKKAQEGKQGQYWAIFLGKQMGKFQNSDFHG